MIRTYYLNSAGVTRFDVPAHEFASLLQDPNGLLWVDFESTPAVSDEKIMREVFHFHPLAIDDALRESHVPKLDDWGEYLYIVLHAVLFSLEEGAHLDTQELDVFLGKNFMVTHHDNKIFAVERLWDLIQRDDRHGKHGPDHLLYRLVDEVVASYMPAVESIDDTVDEIEDQVFGRPTSETLERIFTIKRTTLHLRRIIGPQREVLNKLARDDFSVIDQRDQVYFRDVYDHLVRLQDITESIRDLVSGTLDTYLSVVNNRMNDVMKTLTVITTLFMPISFIASFFGMNFFQPSDPLPTWTSFAMFVLTLILMILTPAAMFFFMRRRNWL